MQFQFYSSPNNSAHKAAIQQGLRIRVEIDSEPIREKPGPGADQLEEKIWYGTNLKQLYILPQYLKDFF